MIKAIVSDFSRVLLFPRDTAYLGGLNKLHTDLSGSLSEYNILDHFELNRELLDFYRTLKGKYRMAIFTKGQVQNVPVLKQEIDQIFEKVYAADELGWSKGEGQSFRLLAESLGVLPDEIAYLDDNPDNVSVASAAGYRAFRYESNAQAIKDITSVLNTIKN